MNHLETTRPRVLDSRMLILLRFLFAAMVIWHHCFALGGYGKSPLLAFSHGQEAVGILAVACFFSLSGFLMTHSYLRSESFLRYLQHRILRIFPGFWVSLLVTVLFFAPFIYFREQGSLAGYFSAVADSPAGFVWKNFLLKMNQYGIAGLLQQNPYPSVWNGSLWTLVVEFICYLALGIFGILGLLKKRKMILAAAILTWAAFVFLVFKKGWQFYPLQARLPWLGLHFLSGMAYALYWDKVRRNWPCLAAAFLGTVLLMKTPAYSIVTPWTLPYLVLSLASLIQIKSERTWQDYSYGIYLYAFPVQQIIASLRWHEKSVAFYFVISLLLTMPFAMIHYHWIERAYRRWK